MIVAITGGSGFIGRALAGKHIANGDAVRVLTRGKEPVLRIPDVAQIHVGDLISNDADLHAFVEDADVLYHCAGEINNPRRMHALHVGGTQRLIEAAAGRIGHWVQLSSVGVYGPVREGVVTESTPLNPVGEYEITKAASDEMVLNTASHGEFSCTILRPSNVFGTDMKNQSLFGMINMINRELFFFIGRSGASANYIHVDNVVEGLVRCGTMPAAKDRIYNLSDHCSMENMVEVIAGELESRLPALRMPELPVRWAARILEGIPGFPLSQARVDALTNRSYYPIERIQTELGYKHVISMEKGLRQLVAAFKYRQ